MLLTNTPDLLDILTALINNNICICNIDNAVPVHIFAEFCCKWYYCTLENKFVCANLIYRPENIKINLLFFVQVIA